MAKSNVKVLADLTNFKSVVKNTQNIDKYLAIASVVTKNEVTSNWLKGNGGDGTRFKAISPEYKKFKAEAGKPARIDMHFSGDMASDLNTKKTGKNKYSVTFFDSNEIKKAKQNASRRPNMMTVSKAFADKIIAKAQDFLMKNLR